MRKVSDSEIDGLLDSGEPDRPSRVGSTGGFSRNPAGLPPGVHRQRREEVSELIATGMSTDQIVDVMASPERGLTEEATRHLMQEVYADWDEEDAERKRYYKAAAIRRIQRHIVKAKAAGSWQAVANLEKVLMMIQGTAEPIEIAQPGDSRLSEALLRVLNEADPREVRRMIEREKTLVTHGSTVVKRLPVPERPETKRAG